MDPSIARAAELLRSGEPSGDEVGLGAVATRLHYSEEHLSRRFRASTGMRMRDFQAGLRIERGIDALLDGGSVAWSQWRAGHRSAASYAHAFRAFTGMSPSAFRRDAPRFAATLRELADSPRSHILVHRSAGADPIPQEHALAIRVSGTRPRSVLFIALNPGPLTRTAPFLGFALFGRDHVTVDAIPNGEYVAMVVEVPLDRGLRPLFHQDANRRALRRERIAFPLDSADSIELALRPLEPSDPPITPNLPRLVLDALLRNDASRASIRRGRALRAES